jgi:integrase/recombinase XerD
VAALIAAQRDEHQIPHAVSCRALGVSRAWFYKWRGGALGPRAQRRERLAAEVARLFAVHEGKYGSPRITADLRDAGWRVSENTVAALMREAGLAARRKKRRKATTRPGRGRWRAPDLVRRKFPAARINTKWYGDGTEIATGQGKLYLSVTWNQDPRVGTGERFGQGSVSASQRRRGVFRGMAGTWADRWPVLVQHERAAEWLQIWADLGRAPRTIDAYARGLAEYLQACDRDGIDPVAATRAQVAAFVRELVSRPGRNGANVVVLDSGVGLANATLQQRLVPVRLFYDFLVEEGLRESNPVGRGRYTPGRRLGGSGAGRGIVPRMVKLPWIPAEPEWLQVLEVFRREPVRNRVMLALAYDAALRREELCCLRTDDLDPGHRTLRVRAETTKTRRERVVPYSVPTGLLLADYLAHRAAISRARGPLFLSESRRNYAEPLSLWSWSKIVRRVALEAGVPRFSTHTTRHLCLTDLARMGWEVHAIAMFAGHRSTDSTLRYIHLSGRELAAKLSSSMAQLHAWRVEMLTGVAGTGGLA